MNESLLAADLYRKIPFLLPGRSKFSSRIVAKDKVSALFLMGNLGSVAVNRLPIILVFATIQKTK